MISRRQTLFLGAGAAALSVAGLPVLAQPLPPGLRAALEDGANAPVMGNPKGTMTLIEFTDYNCGFCRRAAKDVQALIKAEPQLRVIIREWPIFGMGSFYAARAALAARQQGGYGRLHVALMALRSRAEEATVLRAARDAGLDTDRLVRDMAAPEIKAHLLESERLAGALDLQGTPSFAGAGGVEFGQIGTRALKALARG